MAGKPAVVTRVVDSMTDKMLPMLSWMGVMPFLLGAETLRGLYPVDTISTVGKICAEAEKVYNQDLYFKKTVKYVGEPMTHLELIASSAVRCSRIALLCSLLEKFCLYAVIKPALLQQVALHLKSP